MKTTVKTKDFDAVMALPRAKRLLPLRPILPLRILIRVLSFFGLLGSRFRYTTEGMEKIEKGEPCLVLMNHSCFLDLMMASTILFPKPFCIVCTSDGFVGMPWLMRLIGCIPTKKFVTDLSLIKNMEYCFRELKTSVLMYPEASYSFDGTATPLPRKMGVLLKKLDVPVVMINTEGAFTRNPLYNELQVRKSVPVSAHVRCLFTREQLREKTVAELSDELDAAFTFDQFRWQKEQGIETPEAFRADGLHRILFQCAACGSQGTMKGEGTSLSCSACGRKYTLTPLGELEAEGAEFTHIPDYYAWERANIRREIEEGTYRLECDVDIAMMVDYKAIYKVGQGHLVHDCTGFTLTGCDGRLNYSQPPQACYGLYADYYWYELGDVICIGNDDALYYCFPKDSTPVAKPRLAAEEMYKLYKNRKRMPR